jgi:plasmid stability protein
MTTDHEMRAELREIVRQMLRDWEAATPAQREAAVKAAEQAAR